MNQHIESYNEENRKAKNKKKKVQPVTQRQFWVFIGLLIVAAAHGIGGEKLWEKASHRDHFTMTEPINYGVGGLEVMAEYRFNEIRAWFPYAFQDSQAKEEGDPWFMIRGLVNAYNYVRSLWVAASIVKILDESMSAWRPRTTKTGGLPHISWIQRKPEPLGTEFKTVACSKTGMMLHLEIQEGKDAMGKKEYSSEFGGTAACTFRLVDSSKHAGEKWKSRKEAKADDKPEFFKGDSWFTSVVVAEWMAQQGHAYIGAVKTSHKLFPREQA